MLRSYSWVIHQAVPHFCTLSCSKILFVPNMRYLFSGNKVDGRLHPHGEHGSKSLLPPDIYWGTLSGCLESIDSGTAAVIDHAHLNCSPTRSSVPLTGVL